MVTNDLFHGKCLSLPPAANELHRAADDLRAILLGVLRLLLRRHENRPQYPFVDMKFSTITGEDFADDDLIRGPGVIYGWIQGRGLEALAWHHRWLSTDSAVPAALREDLCPRIISMTRRVVTRLEQIRSQRGRLFFTMSPDGTPLGPHPTPEASNFTDLFYARGLSAAGSVLQDPQLLREGRALFETVCADLFSGRFQSDQQSLDPLNSAAGHRPGRHPYGPFMIAIGGASCLLQCTGDAKYLDLGLRLLEHVTGRYLHWPQRPQTFGHAWDVWDFVDDAGAPYRDRGVISSDPGHGIELAGLGLQLVRRGQLLGVISDDLRGRAQSARDQLPQILLRHVEMGFAPGAPGIVKSVDLVSGRVLHPDMPWWSLPEAMRAAVLGVSLADEALRGPLEAVFVRAFNAFVTHYVRRDLHLAAIQTLNAQGQPSSAIPATPDADPGYHTGLSLIDCLEHWPQAWSAGAGL